jgi:hypothetical protein
MKPLTGAIVLLLINVLLCLCACTTREVEQRTPSPDGRYVAEIELVRGVTRNIDLVAVSVSKPSLKDKLLGSSRKNVFAFSGAGDLSVEWKSPHELTVKCIRCPESDTTKMVSEWHGVTISFEVRPIEWKSQP